MKRQNFVALMLGVLAGALLALAKDLGLIPLPVLILYRERHGHNHASSIGRGLQQPSAFAA